MKDKSISLCKYRDVIPQILIYQVASKTILVITMYFIRQLTGFLMWNLERPAFTSGDLPHLMRTWEGWMLLLLGFVILVVYTVFDVNATILISDRLLHRRKLKILPILREAFERLKHFCSLRGVCAILYVSLLAPLAGAAFGISLTTDFAVPEFILSFIHANLLLNVLYSLALAALGVVGTVYIFTFHYVILGDMDVREAMKRSRLAMKAHWKNFLWQYFVFILKSLLLLLLLFAVLYVLPLYLLEAAAIEGYAGHVGIIFVTLLCVAVLAIAALLFNYFLMMKLTILYRSYTQDTETFCRVPDKKKHRRVFLAAAGAVALILVVSLGTAVDFDTNFPAVRNVYIIAHRGGGTLANENTLLSLEAAVEKNAAASEIDVQRTADGYYIINHDTDFKRCCGVEKKPGEMTLAEIKELSVINEQNPLAPATGVATLEEMLDAAKGRISLYIELKGESADAQMVDEVYDMVVERGMLEECVFISLDYEIIDRFETKYPEARTGYLCYFSFGDIASMNCDVLLLEAETATQSNVDKIHAVGKEVNVWTVNSLTAMTSFMTSDVDGIITDEVAQANAVRQLLESRDDVARVIQRLIP